MSCQEWESLTYKKGSKNVFAVEQKKIIMSRNKTSNAFLYCGMITVRLAYPDILT